MNDTEQQAPEPQLEPCVCGEPVTLSTRKAGLKQADCHRCGRQGPLSDSAWMAIRLWNNDRAPVAAPVNDANRAAYSELIHIAAELARGDGFLSTCAEDMNPRLKRADILKTAERQEERLKDWAYRVRQAANKLSRSAASPVQASDPAEGKLKHSDGVCICTHPQWDHWSWGSGSCAHCSCGKFAAATTVAPVEQPDAVEWSQGSL
jgi:hypothetical protein